MIVLALDTALNATSVAVVDGGRVLAAHTERMERGHQERLAGIMRDTMAEARTAFSTLGRIGVTVGPGSFTGLRVGLAFAKGLSVALNIPCVGIGTLQALAASVNAPDMVAAAIDARRGQIYLGLFQGGAPLMAPEVLSLEDAEGRLDAAVSRGPVIVVGSGAMLLASRPGLSIDTRTLVDPLALARLTSAARDPISRPEPLYLRAPDAKTIAERASAS